MGLAFDVYEVLRDGKIESPAHPETGRAFNWGSVAVSELMEAIAAVRYVRSMKLANLIERQLVEVLSWRYRPRPAGRVAEGFARFRLTADLRLLKPTDDSRPNPAARFSGLPTAGFRGAAAAQAAQPLSASRPKRK